MPQMAWFVTSSAISIYLGSLGYIISMLPVHKKGSPVSGEGNNGTITGVKIFCGQYLLVNVLIADHSDCIEGRGIKPFPNQLVD